MRRVKLMRGRRVSDLGEEGLVSVLTNGWPQREGLLLQGKGHDCAVLQSGPGKHLLFKTDATVEGVHFTQQSSPRQIGWKAMARCVSDIAASGGVPRVALITLGCRADESVPRLQSVYHGIAECASTFGISLGGGETTLCDALTLSVSLIGEVARKHLCLRSGARAGDLICVTGLLGGSLRGRHLEFTPRLEEAQWLVSHAKPTSMMDLSDGLAKDLPRLCRSSKLGAELDELLIPISKGCTLRQAFDDGEDFELLFTVSPRKRKVLDKWPFSTPLTVIGKMKTGRPPKWGDGHDHFKKR